MLDRHWYGFYWIKHCDEKTNTTGEASGLGKAFIRTKSTNVGCGVNTVRDTS